MSPLFYLQKKNRVETYHGAPKAPLPSASCVVSFSRAFIASLPAAAMMRCTSSAVNSNSPPFPSPLVPAPANPFGTAASALATLSAVVRSVLGGAQKRWKR